MITSLHPTHNSRPTIPLGLGHSDYVWRACGAEETCCELRLECVYSQVAVGPE